jgi:hypothetical protein
MHYRVVSIPSFRIMQNIPNVKVLSKQKTNPEAKQFEVIE